MNRPLGMSHHQTSTPRNRQLGWCLLWRGQARLNHSGKKSCTTHRPLNLWLANAGSGRHSAFRLRQTRANIRTLLPAPRAMRRTTQRGFLLQVNPLPRPSSRGGGSPLGYFFCKDLDKSICCSLKEGLWDAAQAVHPSWSPRSLQR